MSCATSSNPCPPHSIKTVDEPHRSDNGAEPIVATCSHYPCDLKKRKRLNFYSQAKVITQPKGGGKQHTSYLVTMSRSDYPKFSDLPLQKDGPHGNAWGLWGADDQLGTLNLLSDEIIAQAAKENIITGQRTSLK
jgi:hypothetical protein